MVSLREIKRRIKGFLPNDIEISKKGLVKLKGEIEKEIDNIVLKAVEEFRELNKLREIQKLPKLKRFIHGKYKYFDVAEADGRIGQIPIEKLSYRHAEVEVT